MSEQQSEEAAPGRRRPTAFLIWLSGADQTILDEVPSDRAKYQGMGGAVLTTATLAGVSMLFALRMAVNASYLVAIPLAVLWAVGILNLDRWLVSSMQRSGGFVGFLKIGIPRLVLALLFGAVISTPLTLQIFAPEINQQIQTIHQQETDAFERSQTNGDTGRTIQSLQTERQRLQAKVTTDNLPPDVESDPEVIKLRSEISTEQKLAADDRRKAGCEADGLSCAGTSGKAGAGPLFGTYINDANAADQRAKTLQGQLNTLIAKLNSAGAVNGPRAAKQDQASLNSVNQRLSALIGEQSRQQATYYHEVHDNTGLLIRLKGLSRATAGDGTLVTARLLLLALITAIECLPILVKALSLLGAPSAYERCLAEHEQTAVAVYGRRVRNQRRIGQIQQNDELTYANALQEEREHTTRAMAKQTAQAESRIQRLALERWEKEMEARIDEFVDLDLPDPDHTTVGETRPDLQPRPQGDASFQPWGDPPARPTQPHSDNGTRPVRPTQPQPGNANQPVRSAAPRAGNGNQPPPPSGYSSQLPPLAPPPAGYGRQPGRSVQPYAGNGVGEGRANGDGFAHTDGGRFRSDRSDRSDGLGRRRSFERERERQRGGGGWRRWLRTMWPPSR